MYWYGGMYMTGAYMPGGGPYGSIPIAPAGGGGMPGGGCIPGGIIIICMCCGIIGFANIRGCPTGGGPASCCCDGGGGAGLALVPGARDPCSRVRPAAASWCGAMLPFFVGRPRPLRPFVPFHVSQLNSLFLCRRYASRRAKICPHLAHVRSTSRSVGGGGMATTTEEVASGSASAVVRCVAVAMALPERVLQIWLSRWRWRSYLRVKLAEQ